MPAANLILDRDDAILAPSATAHFYKRCNTHLLSLMSFPCLVHTECKSLRQQDPTTVWQQRRCAEYPVGLCFLVGSFTYKTGRPICLRTGCGHKVRIPSFEHSKDPHSGVLHRERLTTNTKHDSSVHVSGKEGNYGSFGEA